MICPQCGSEHIVKNGVRENGEQNHPRLLCNRQFVENPLCHHRVPEETKALIDRLLLEKIPLDGTARLPFIGDALFVIQISGMRIKRLFRSGGIKLSGKKRDPPTILSDLTIRRGGEFHARSEAVRNQRPIIVGELTNNNVPNLVELCRSSPIGKYVS